MALRKRHLIPALLLLVMGACPLLLASAEADAPTFRALAVNRAIFDIYFDLQNRPVRFSASDSGLSARYELPPGGRLALYRRAPAEEPDSPPVRVEVAETLLSGPGPHLLLVATAPSPDESGHPRVALKPVDASWSAHPIDSIRIFNLSVRPAALQYESETHPLSPGDDIVLPYPRGASRAWFRIAFLENGVWKPRVGGPQPVIPGTRSIILLSDSPPDLHDPEGELIKLRNIIDTTRPPDDPRLAGH